MTQSPEESPTSLKYSLPTLIIGGLVLVGVGFLQLHPHLEAWVSWSEHAFDDWLHPKILEQNLWLLLPTAFFGGLISSVSPCILTLLPVNLSYIGTLDAESRREALMNAGGFVAGVVTVLSLFGLISAFAGAIVVDYKGYVHLAVGLISLILGLKIAGYFNFQIPQGVSELPVGVGSFGVGTTFALVTSPCASPVLVSMLLAAGATGNMFLSVATMVCYALGYTATVLVCSIATGMVKHLGWLKQHVTLTSRLAAGMLILAGLWYGISGIVWIMS